MPKVLKSSLPPKLVRLLQHKLETGELTPEECKTVLKEYMLREFDRTQTQHSPIDWKALAVKLQSRSRSFFHKVWHRSPTEPTISMEELAGTVRARHI